MNRCLFLKICSLILIMTFILTTFTSCKKDTSNTDSSNHNSSQSVSSDKVSNTQSSDNQSSDDNLLSEESTADKEVSSEVSNKEMTVLVDQEYDADKNPLRRGINLSNFEMHDEIGYENWIFDSKYYTEIFEKGFDHVRLPVDFFDFIDMKDAPNYTIDEETMRKIDTIINIALSTNLSIVLDFHHFGVLQTNYNANKDKYLKIWEQLAIRYQNYPSGLVFELINEPGSPGTIKDAPDPLKGQKIVDIQNEAIKIIRKTNPTRLIVHATNYFNHYNSLNSTILPDDDNLIMSVHVYFPYDFTHQGTTWMSDAYSGLRPYGEDVRIELDNIFYLISEYQKSTGRPVWIGEFGVTNKASAEDRYKYAEVVNELANQYKLGWCWFEFSSGFGIYDLKKGDWTADGVADALTK